ncbi:hypothetical protein FGU71_10730 [Erythrobacter insulae]|uniref:Lipoprotein n=1 Tax=Erythrobacter insulae TaxID=2584124 RepID=A0A547PDT5_9SPHN|nr:hypothetical protein [Erythrobacter insulae]TRD12289.1 hypothetical protein FGU71_10730 [Erythrobacter insulae]
MKAIYLKTAGAIALTAAIAACVPSINVPLLPPEPTVPVAAPAPAPSRDPVPAIQEPRYENYLDAPQTPGTWRYQQSAAGPIAVFVAPDGNGEFLLSCNRRDAAIGFWRSGTSASPRAMRIRTETTARTFQVLQAEDTNPYLTVDVPANDTLLDAMAITKGRFAVEVEGQRTLYLPAWVEVTRVIEDCR